MNDKQDRHSENTEPIIKIKNSGITKFQFPEIHILQLHDLHRKHFEHVVLIEMNCIITRC